MYVSRILSLLRKTRVSNLSGLYCNLSHKAILSGEEDRYNGIIIESEKNNLKDIDFKKVLRESLEKWNSQRKHCIWFKVVVNDALIVPILAKEGFHFHYARNDFVMMYKWLPKLLKPNLPPAPHTNLGVGAMVFNNKCQILAISEQNYDYPHWKLPGGYVEKDEDIISAGVREVKEETGVVAAFQSLITLRHTHNMMFNNSDIYIILMMKALTDEINISDREVRKSKWIDVDEYINHPHVHEFNRLVVEKALEYRRNKIKLDIEKKHVKWAKFERNMNYLTLKEYDYD